jgi:hypothetical protein
VAAKPVRAASGTVNPYSDDDDDDALESSMR